MSVLFLILRILGIVLLVLLVLAVIVLMLPAGLRIRWQHGGELEIWLTAGPVRRRFFPPREEEKESPSAARNAAGTGASPAASAAAAPPPKAEPERASGSEEASGARDSAGRSPASGPADPGAEGSAGAASPGQEDEIDRLYQKLMSDPVGYARKIRRWAAGPGRYLLDRLKVRRVRIVWTVTESSAAATAVTYGALMAAGNTAWAIFRDHVNAQADELRIVPDFTGERTAERCFACQITAKLYIIIAAILLTLRANLRRRAAAQARRAKAAGSGRTDGKPA